MKIELQLLAGTLKGENVYENQHTAAPDKQLCLRKALKNCYPQGEDKACENLPLFHLLCALLKLSHSFNSVAISTAGFRMTLFQKAVATNASAAVILIRLVVVLLVSAFPANQTANQAEE